MVGIHLYFFNLNHFKKKKKHFVKTLIIQLGSKSYQYSTFTMATNALIDALLLPQLVIPWQHMFQSQAYMKMQETSK